MARSVATIALLAAAGCRQILGLTDPALVDAPIVDAQQDSSADSATNRDPCAYELLFTIPAPGSFQGLAARDGVLYGVDIAPTPDEIVALADDGARTRITNLSFTTVAFAASDTHFYVDDEGGGQLIHEISRTDPSATRVFPTGITGGNRGLAFAAGRVWHLGAAGSVVGFAEIRISDGAFVQHHVASAAIDAQNADSDGQHLLYVTSSGVLHAMDLGGVEVCSRSLPMSVIIDASMMSIDALGLAADAGRLYLYDRVRAVVFVLGQP